MILHLLEQGTDEIEVNRGATNRNERRWNEVLRCFAELGASESHFDG